MNGKRLLPVAGVIALAVLTLAACSSSSKSSSSTSTSSASSPTTSGGGAPTTSGGGASTSGNKASATGVTTNSVTVGLETDITGIASSTFADTAQGVKARFDQQNAQGGVNGRTLKMEIGDTTSSPAGAQTAAQELVSQKNVFGVIGVTALFFGAYKYLNAHGIPVTGSSLDGPEWYTQPNTNMFNIEGTSSPLYPSYTSQGEFWKSLGVKKISFVASNTPSSTRAVKQEINSIKAAGLSTCAGATVPLGAVDFTAVALAIKNAGCDAAECSCVLSSSLAMSTAVQNAGLTIPFLFEAGPSQGVFQTPATEKAASGGYFTAQINYFSSAYNQMQAALKQYVPGYPGGIPDLGVIAGWQAADLFIRGLQAAGQNPTRQSYITNLRTVTGWDANGLKPAPAVFNPFGQAPPHMCFAYLKFANNQYSNYPAPNQPYCGTLIPNSNAA